MIIFFLGANYKIIVIIGTYLCFEFSTHFKQGNMPKARKNHSKKSRTIFRDGKENISNRNEYRGKLSRENIKETYKIGKEPLKTIETTTKMGKPLKGNR